MQSCVLYVSCEAETQQRLISFLRTSYAEPRVVWLVVKWWTRNSQQVFKSILSVHFCATFVFATEVMFQNIVLL